MIDQFGNWRADFPGQQPFQDPQFVRLYGQQPTQPTQTGQQSTPQVQRSAAMTLPTIHAEIVQVEGEAAATQYPVGAGMSQMMMAKDESAIYIKEATVNGYTLNVFEKRPPAPQAAPFNPAEYVRLDALPEIVEKQVQAVLAAIQPAKTARGKKETEATE